MAYTTGMLRHRVKILNRKEATASEWGKDGSGIEWEEAAEVWASVDYNRGKHAMMEGALDVYAVVIVRMRWNPIITMRSRIRYDGNDYQIIGDTFHAEMQDNTIQFHAQLLVNETS